MKREAGCTLHGGALVGGRCLTCSPPNDASTIHVESVVSGHPERWGTGSVRIVIGDYALAMSPQEARHHALAVLEIADGAETDSLMLAFLTRGGMSRETAAASLLDFRKLREDRRVARDDQGVTKLDGA